MAEMEERGENDQEEDGVRSSFHGHTVMTSAHDLGPRSYLRGLDADEARPIFNYARVHGDAQIEIRERGLRTNYEIEYKTGRYNVRNQGRQRSGSR